MRVELEAQAVAFVRKQAPDPKRRLREALKDLGRERGDIKGLEPPLDEYQRLRVGPFRVIFRHTGRSIRCVFAERRGIVYEVFSEILLGDR